MTIRKQTKAEEIEDLKIEMKNRQESLERLVKEGFELGDKMMAGNATKKDQKRAEEIKSLCDSHTAWINAHKKEISNFYRPAMVINPAPQYGIV